MRSSACRGIPARNGSLLVVWVGVRLLQFSRVAVCVFSVLLAAASAQSPSLAVPTLRPNPARFAGEIEAFAKQEPEKGGIVFTGSSSIRLWSRLKEDFAGLPVVNRGFGGSVANDLIVNFETVVARHEPKMIVTYTGGNDINENLTVQEAFEDYTKFLGMAHERFPEAKVILTSVKVCPQRVLQTARVHELNKLLQEWCANKPWVRYVDCTSYLCDAEDKPIASFFVADHIHLNQAGYAEWLAILLPVVKEEWDEVQSKQ